MERVSQGGEEDGRLWADATEVLELNMPKMPAARLERDRRREIEAVKRKGAGVVGEHDILERSDQAQVVAEREKRDGIPVLHSTLRHDDGSQRQVLESGVRVSIEKSRGEERRHEGGAGDREALEIRQQAQKVFK